MNETKGTSANPGFMQLTRSIQIIDRLFKDETAKAVNRNITARNWLIGYYLFQYEQCGEDRAKYGTRLLQSLAKELKSPSLSYGNLKLYRQFYQEFRQLIHPIREYVATRNSIVENLPPAIGQTLLGQIAGEDGSLSENPTPAIGQTPLGQLPPATIFNRLPYSHLTLLFPIKDPTKRTFYEMECMKGTWSYRELKRQIDTNYYERTVISHSPQAMSDYVQQQSEHLSLAEVVKTPHIYEFLGLKDKDIVEESDLEQTIMNHLQDYLLELGEGFCFEARQKRLLIDDEYFYCDLVFYHRILKCHVIVELKSHQFNYADLAQLNMYVAYYKKNIKQADDNPPIGILLCTEIGREQVEYAIAGMDQQLFISKYLLELPSKKDLEQWLNQEIKSFDSKVQPNE